MMGFSACPARRLAHSRAFVVERKPIAVQAVKSFITDSDS